MTNQLPVGNQRPLDPVKAEATIRNYFATTDDETMGRDFAEFEAEILADMELASETE